MAIPETKSVELNGQSNEGRLIVVGDVHGCARELKSLLDQLDRKPADRWVFVGDLVNRGPDSAGVLDVVRELPVFYATLGNHEARLLRYRQSGDATELRSYDWETLNQLRPEDWELLESMPLTVEAPGHEAVVVHGGFLPNPHWREQEASVVTNIQVISPEGVPAKRTDSPLGVSWAEYWKGPPYVIYGHTPRENIFRREWSLGIDTGCVYGGALTAVILPGREIIQVPARKAYAR